ncbi:hypothetical protein EJ110_NYTH00108 [Nymphaea thermarum]|nr:hypothetical protein EJ110_NYTH00108 [Nymphaea thermarum]
MRCGQSPSEQQEYYYLLIVERGEYADILRKRFLERSVLPHLVVILSRLPTSSRVSAMALPENPLSSKSTPSLSLHRQSWSSSEKERPNSSSSLTLPRHYRSSAILSQRFPFPYLGATPPKSKHPNELRMAVKEVLCDADNERHLYEEALIAITVEESLKRQA